MNMKCQDVVKCELYLYSRYHVLRFSECNNCVASFGTAKRKIRIVGINLKSIFSYIMQLMSEKFIDRHSKNF